MPIKDDVQESQFEQLIQFITRSPRLFILLYGSGPAMIAAWLFVISIQQGLWLWASVTGSWLISIIIGIGFINYLLPSRDERKT